MPNTKTPKVYSISYAEIENFVRKLPKDDSYAGECGDGGRCLVALAVKAKYKPTAVTVGPASWPKSLIQINYQRRSKVETWHTVQMGEDEARIRSLIHEFDHLGTHRLTTKADVLPLFEEAA
jgi:diaminopimelate epimerase